jgi:hypothetical protein
VDLALVVLELVPLDPLVLEKPFEAIRLPPVEDGDIEVGYGIDLSGPASTGHCSGDDKVSSSVT